MTDVYEIAIKISLLNETVSKLNQMAQQFSDAGSHVSKLNEHLSKVAALGSVGASMWRDSTEALKSMIDPAREMARQVVRMNEAGSSQIEIAKNVATAWAGVKGPVTAISNLERINEYSAILAEQTHGKTDVAKNMQLARQLVDPMNQLRTVLLSQTGSAGVADTQLSAMLKFSEMRGHLTLPEIMNDAEQLTKATVATRGQVLPSMMTQSLKYAGNLKTTLNDEFLFTKLPELILEMKTGQGGGASRAGVLVQALGRTLGQGHMSKALAANLTSLGLLDAPLKVLGTTTTNTIASVAGHELLMKDPSKWLDTVALPRLAKAHPEAMGDRTKLNELFVQTFSGSSMFTSAMLELLNKQPAFHKLAAQTQQIGSTQDMIKAASQDPAVQMIALQDSMVNLRTALGNSVIPVIVPLLDTLSAGINKLAVYAQAHPNLGNDLMKIGVGVAAVGGSLMVLGGVASVTQSIMTISKGLSALGGICKFVMSAEFIPAVVAGLGELAVPLLVIGVVVGGVALAVQHFNEIMKFAQDHVGALRAAWALLLITNTPLVIAIKGITYLTQHWGDICDWGIGVINNFIGGFNNLMNTLVGWYNTITGSHLTVPQAAQLTDKTLGKWSSGFLNWAGLPDITGSIPNPVYGPYDSDLNKSQHTWIGQHQKQQIVHNHHNNQTIAPGAITINKMPGETDEHLAQRVIDKLKEQMKQASMATGLGGGTMTGYPQGAY